jgi:tRNA(Ile2) C34 agmatinyltransferase TiaS
MYCPKCGDRMETHGDKLKCTQGEMELTLDMATGLRESFGETGTSVASKTPRPPSRRSGWFCPGCGVPMKETSEPRGVKCPRCGRTLGKFVWALIVHHPHKFGDEWG